MIIKNIFIAILTFLLSSQAYAACGDPGGGNIGNPFVGTNYGTILFAHTIGFNSDTRSLDCAEYVVPINELHEDIEKAYTGSITFPDSDAYTSSISASVSVENFNFNFINSRNFSDDDVSASSRVIPRAGDIVTFTGGSDDYIVPFNFCTTFNTGSGETFSTYSDIEIISASTLNTLTLSITSPPSNANVRVINDAVTIRIIFDESVPTEQCLTGSIRLQRSTIVPSEQIPVYVALKGNLNLSFGESLAGEAQTNYNGRFRFTSLPDGVTCSTASGTPSACGGGTTNPEPEYPYDARPSKCPNDCGTSVGNPINFSLGFKHQTEIDYSNDLLSFLRYYRSDAEWYSSSIGQRWRHNFDRSIVIDGNQAEVLDASGLIYFYQSDSNGNWSILDDDNHSTATLIETADGFIYTPENDNREYFNNNGQLIRIERISGNTVDLSYDSQNRLSLITDEKGRTLTLSYNGTSTYIESLETPDGIFTYEYDGNNNLISITKPDSQSQTYHYENSSFIHALTGVTDENNIRLSTYSYDVEGRAISSEHIGGVNDFTVSYNNDNSVTTTNPLGKQTTYHFETIKGVRRIVRVEGHASANCAAANQAYTYDERGFVASKTDWNGNLTTYTRDDRGLVLTMTEDSGGTAQRLTTYTYTPDYRLPDIITEEGKVTDYDYDTHGRIVSMSVTDPQSNEKRTVMYSYHPNSTDGNGQTVLGKLASVDGARTDVDDITRYVYDANFNLTQTTNALGHTTRTTSFDNAGRPLIQIDENNIETHYAYDQVGRLIQTFAAFGTVNEAITIFTYDNAGNLTQTQFPNGVTLTNQYDNAQRLVGIDDTLGNRISYILDAAGNRLREEYFDETNTLYYRFDQAFDELSRLLSSTDANNDTISYTYDLNNNLTSTTDGNTNTTQFVFDGLDRFVQHIDALNGETDNQYNAIDQNTSVTDPRNNQTQYTYNAFGDLISQLSPDTGTTSWTYDNAGNILSQTDARGIVMNMSYDALNRPLTKTYPSDSTLNIVYSYDNTNDCAFSVGRICSVEHAGGTRAYQYDELGRVITSTETRDTTTLITQYTYDAAGALINVTYPSGREVTHTLNANGQIESIALNHNNNINSLATNIHYLPFGRIENFTMGNGVTLTNQFNIAYQLENRRIANSNLDTFFDQVYQYDMAGNLLSTSDVTYEYDALYRLTDEDSASGLFEFEYDSVGNRLSQSHNDINTLYTYPTDNQYLIAANDQDYIYDANGNLIDNGVLLLNYAANNRLAQIQGQNANANYVYNDLNQRIEKHITPSTTGQETVNTINNRVSFYQSQVRDAQSLLIDSPVNDNDRLVNLRQARLINLYNERIVLAQSQINDITLLPEERVIYIYNQSGLLMGEYTPQGDTIREYVYLNGEPLAQIAANDNITYIHTDHLGTPRVASNDNGEEVWRWDSDAFGNNIPTISNNTVINLRFAGQYYDKETHLYYNWHRYYDPALGRYITSDPIGLNGGINTYGYALQNPVMYFDSDGQEPLTVILLSAGYFGIGYAGVSSLATGIDLYQGDITPKEAAINSSLNLMCAVPSLAAVKIARPLVKFAPKNGVKNSVIGKPRIGSAKKTDPTHRFNDIIDNYAGNAKRFDIPTKGPNGQTARTSELRQIEGGLNGKNGVFEWIVDQDKVTHRRFIPGGKVTGLPNQVSR